MPFPIHSNLDCAHSLRGTLHGHGVALTLPVAGHLATTLVIFHLLNPPELLELLHEVTDDLAARLREVLRAGPTALAVAEGLAQAAHASALADVDLPHDRRRADVHPIAGIRSQLLHVASLDVLGPLRDVNLVLVLHVLRESLDELLSVHVLERSHVARCQDRLHRAKSWPAGIWKTRALE